MTKNIVVIDDDSITLDIIVAILEDQFDVTVYSFVDSRMAYRFFQESYDAKLSLIISDVIMPGYTGIELLAFIRRQNIKAPVILVSAEGTREHAVQAKKHGAQGFMVKPLKRDDLIEKVRSLLK